MKANQIPIIFDQFDHLSSYASHCELNSGHVNDTYLIKTQGSKNYVLQRVNHTVFKDVPNLIRNKVLVSNHLRNKYPHLSQSDLDKKVLSFVKVKNTDLYYDKEGADFWNLMIFIQDSYTHEVVTDEQIAYEGGKILGEFLNLTSDFDSSQLSETIPKFHDMTFRYQQYDASIENARPERVEKVTKYRKLISELKEEMHILQNLKQTGGIPSRVTHNDTKISNTLFDKNNKGICMIDMDTIMPGIVHYDFGDAIRTICNTAAEDEKDLSKVTFNVAYYKAYLKGFLEQTRDSLTPVEIEYLPLAAKTMIFIMGIRFLTDYLNNDIYYKIDYPEHNLHRAKNQFKLIESLSQQIERIK